MFYESNCGEESDIGLCKISRHAEKVHLRSADFRQILWPNTFFDLKSALRSRTIFASPEVVHRPRSELLLLFQVDPQNICQIHLQK